MHILNAIVAALTSFGFVILNLFGASSVPAIKSVLTAPIHQATGSEGATTSSKSAAP